MLPGSAEETTKLTNYVLATVIVADFVYHLYFTPQLNRDLKQVDIPEHRTSRNELTLVSNYNVVNCLNARFERSHKIRRNCKPGCRTLFFTSFIRGLITDMFPI